MSAGIAFGLSTENARPRTGAVDGVPGTVFVREMLALLPTARAGVARTTPSTNATTTTVARRARPRAGVAPVISSPSPRLQRRRTYRLVKQRFNTRDTPTQGSA